MIMWTVVSIYEEMASFSELKTYGTSIVVWFLWYMAQTDEPFESVRNTV